MNKYKKLIKDTFIFAIGSFGSKLILFFLVPLYTNYLSAEEYGTTEMVFTLGNLVNPVLSLVIYDAVLRFSLDRTKNRNSVILNAVLIYAAGSLGALLLGPVFGLYNNLHKWRWFVSAYVISCMGVQIFQTYIKSKENSKLYVTIGISQTMLLALLNILLLTVFKLRIFGYLLASILANVLTACYAFIKGDIFADLKKAKFDSRLLKEMLIYSSPLIINNISWWVIQSSDKMMIDLFLGSAALGLYSVASKIPALINVITSFFSQAWSISSIKEFDSSRDTSFFEYIFSFFAAAIFEFCACLLILIKPFMKIYVGDEFFVAWQYIPYLLTAASFSAVSAFFGSIYDSLKKSVNVMVSTLLSGTVNIVLNFLLIPYIGVGGATIATAISYASISIYRLFDTRRYFKFPINFTVLITEELAICVAAYCVTTFSHGYIAAIAAVLTIAVLNWSIIKNLYNKIIVFLKRNMKNEAD